MKSDIHSYFWGPFCKMASKVCKSITFIDKTHTAFRYVKKPYKTNEKQGFPKAKNALRKPLSNLCQIDDFRVEIARRPPK